MQRFARVTVLSLTAVFFLLLGLVIVAPLVVHAEDEPSVEAAEVVSPELNVEHLRAEIAGESDPELRAAMEEQLELIESGQLDLQTLEGDFARDQGIDPGSVVYQLPDGSITADPRAVFGGTVGTERTAIGGRTGGQTRGESLPPEAQAELEKIFSQGTGDPSKDGALREQAEKVMEKYGIEQPGRIDGDHDYGRGGGMEGPMTSPREAFQQWESSEQGQNTDSATREQYREMSEQYQAEFERGGSFERGGEFGERAMEHMAPEAREQMERFMNEREMGSQEMSREGMERGGMEREMMERELGGPSSERSYEAPTHEYESQTREYEAPTREYESMTREYEAPTREYEAPSREYETQTREYEAPAREYEAPTHEYEAPTREYEAPTREYDAPTHEYEAPTHEYEAPQGPGDGSGTPY